MKESEVRLMQENKSLLEHQKSQNVLVTNLQTLQVSIGYMYISNIDISKSEKKSSFVLLCLNIRYNTMQFNYKFIDTPLVGLFSDNTMGHSLNDTCIQGIMVIAFIMCT